MKQFSYNAVILTAGESSRMGGFPKALLTLPGGVTFIENIIKSLLRLVPPPEKIIPVTGTHRDRITPALAHFPVSPVVNEAPSRGMLSSIQQGILACEDRCRGILLCLVDHPMVADATYQLVLEAAMDSPGHIIIPTYNQRGGHPVFFSREFFPHLMEAPLNLGARHVTQSNRDRVLRIATKDPGIRYDIDTPVIYKNILGQAPDH